MKKILIRLVLFVLSLFLIFALYLTIREPIQFRKEYKRRKNAVVAKLKDIRTAQKLYRGLTDSFATNFDDLERALTTGKFKIIQVTGDRDALDAQVSYDTLYVNAADSIKSLGLDVKNLRTVPFSNGQQFKIEAKMIDQQGYTIPVVEVWTTWESFMGPYKDIKYKKYDAQYDPTAKLKFGSTKKANLSGNWE